MQILKKYWPVAFLVFALIFVFLVWFLVIRDKGGNKVTEDANVPELPLEQRPFVILTPKEDGHWLKMAIKGLTRVQGAVSMDYELLYKVPDGRTQGVPGTVVLSGSDSIDRELLLGSESS